MARITITIDLKEELTDKQMQGIQNNIAKALLSNSILSEKDYEITVNQSDDNPKHISKMEM